MKRINPSAAARKRLYRLGLALIGVAVVYGLLSGEEAAAWALVLAPLLGLADHNVTD